jgi:hypothetical protein
MVDTASITIAVLSLTTSLAVAIASGVLTIYSDERKDRRERERLLRKYHDPLLLAAQDLQARLYNLTENALMTFLHGSQDHQDCLVIYTAFLFGQYLSWTYILRQQAQFACFATEERGRTKLFVDLLGKIRQCLNSDAWGGAEVPFMLWKGHQLAIGELMTVPSTLAVPDSAGGVCMGFAEFTRKWKAQAQAEDVRVAEPRPAPGSANEPVPLHQNSEDPAAFRVWFLTIEHGIYELDRQRQLGESTGLNRIRRLQHLLLELIDVLDPEGARVGAHESKRVGAAPGCACSQCRDSVQKKKRETSV